MADQALSDAHTASTTKQATEEATGDAKSVAVSKEEVASQAKVILRGSTKRTSLMIVETIDDKVEEYVKDEGILKSRFINEALLEKLIRVGAIQVQRLEA